MVKILAGDCLDQLRTLPDESVQCCVTSPPYWGLRDYGHEGQIGLEKTPAEYVAKMVSVFREVLRLLRNDGTLWLNLGDSYATGAGAVGDCPGGGKQGEAWKGHRGSRGGSAKQPHTGAAIGPMVQPNRMPIAGLKPKDLVGVPWMVAFALRADGWYLRSDIIWAKPNPMPESVTDRPTKAHEYMFLLAKSQRYYYDADAIAERKAFSTVSDDRTNANGHRRFRDYPGAQTNGGTNLGGAEGDRNKRTVWTVATAPYPEAHFATYPPDLIKPCILAGSKPGDTILDPFGGSGTTGMVALELGRKAILIELNPAYIPLIEQRTNVTPGFSFAA